MKHTHERDARFEQILRREANHERRAAPHALASRVMREVHQRAAGRVSPGARLSSSWHRAALAASIAVAATVITAAMLLQTPSPRGTAVERHVVLADDDRAAVAGPMAMLASLQRTPDDISSAIHDAMTREMNLFLEDILNEPRRFIAHLPLQGRIDHEAEQMP